MKKLIYASAILFSISVSFAQMIVAEPDLEKIPHHHTKHQDTRIDNYFWLKDRTNPNVINYLNSENAYYEAKTAHTKQFQEDLFQEMKSRIKEDDESVPYKKKNYYYITRFEKGNQYPIYSRKKESLDSQEQIMFDVNELGKGFNYFKLAGLSISPNNELAVFGVDTVGRR
jgi:oligopeptidase B